MPPSPTPLAHRPTPVPELAGRPQYRPAQPRRAYKNSGIAKWLSRCAPIRFAVSQENTPAHWRLEFRRPALSGASGVVEWSFVLFPPVLPGVGYRGGSGHYPRRGLGPAGPTIFLKYMGFPGG